jgi:hypothetical protein
MDLTQRASGIIVSGYAPALGQAQRTLSRVTAFGNMTPLLHWLLT